MDEILNVCLMFGVCFITGSTIIMSARISCTLSSKLSGPNGPLDMFQISQSEIDRILADPLKMGQDSSQITQQITQLYDKLNAVVQQYTKDVSYLRDDFDETFETKSALIRADQHRDLMAIYAEILDQANAISEQLVIKYEAAKHCLTGLLSDQNASKIQDLCQEMNDIVVHFTTFARSKLNDDAQPIIDEINTEMAKFSANPNVYFNDVIADAMASLEQSREFRRQSQERTRKTDEFIRESQESRRKSEEFSRQVMAEVDQLVQEYKDEYGVDLLAEDNQPVTDDELAALYKEYGIE